MAELVSQRACNLRGLAMWATTARALAWGGKDPDDGLCLHPSSGQGSGPTASREKGHTEAVAAGPPKSSPPAIVDGVDKMYH
jgi:hypothetical protein